MKINQSEYKQPMKMSVKLRGYIAGLEGVDLNRVMIAGENLVDNFLWISIYDLPKWLKSKARFKLKLNNADIKRCRDYFNSIDLRKNISQRKYKPDMANYSLAKPR